MSDKRTALPECVFCRIVARTIPSHVVYEDDMFIAFLSVDPVSPGHTLVIPKDHYRWVWDVSTIGAYFEVVQKVALAMKKAFREDMIESKVVGEEVPHAHVWLFPRRGTKGNKKDFAGNADMIRQALAE
jgi:histidine triad (HIT) family protein